MPSSVASKRMPSSIVMDVGGAVGAGDLERDDLVLELAGLGRRDRALVALKREFVELVLRQIVFLRDHFGAGELAELDVRDSALPCSGSCRCPCRPWRRGCSASPSARASCSRRRRRSRCPCEPDITACAAKCSACCDEPHCRSIEVPGTLSGSFDASTALRPMLTACSPAWPTQPMMTSSIWSGSAPVRSTSAFEHRRGEIGRMPAREAAALAAAGGAGGGDDIGLGHGFLLPDVCCSGGPIGGGFKGRGADLVNQSINA